MTDVSILRHAELGFLAIEKTHSTLVLKISQKLNKWTQDENSAWRDMVFHAKNFKMEKIVEREFSKNAFGILITNLENILKLDEHNFFKKADSPLVTVQMNLNRFKNFHRNDFQKYRLSHNR